MSNLSQQYRRALRWYPKSWREKHEEALIGVLLDQAEAEGREHMSRTARRDILRHGLRQSFTRPRVALATALALIVMTVLVWPVGTGPCHWVDGLNGGEGLRFCYDTQVSSVGIYLPNVPGGTTLATAILAFILALGMCLFVLAGNRKSPGNWTASPAGPVASTTTPHTRSAGRLCGRLELIYCSFGSRERKSSIASLATSDTETWRSSATCRKRM